MSCKGSRQWPEHQPILRSLARSHTEMGLRVLAGIAENGTSESARVAVVGLLLDRGWGKAPQSHSVEWGDGESA